MGEVNLDQSHENCPLGALSLVKENIPKCIIENFNYRSNNRKWARKKFKYLLKFYFNKKKYLNKFCEHFSIFVNI